MQTDDSALTIVAPPLPDNSRRPKGSANPRDVPKKIWVDRNEAEMFEILTKVYGSSESALIRWLIELGIEQVIQKAKTEDIHRQLHERFAQSEHNDDGHGTAEPTGKWKDHDRLVNGLSA